MILSSGADNVGFGPGSATTEIDGDDVGDSLGSGVDEVAVDMGLKVGYGPITGMPLYFAATLETSEAEQNSSMLSIFVKYAFRHK